MRHNYPIEIFYEDTDAVGLVYHTNFIKYMERARTVLFREKGLSLPTLVDKFRIQFLVKSLEIQYVRPVRLQQMIVVATKIGAITRTTLTFDQYIYFDPANPDTMICSGKTKIVCINMDFKPCPIPEPILRELDSET